MATDRPSLSESDLDPDPSIQFDAWFREASDVLPQPDAMALATASPDGRPSVRMVLLKDAGAGGFVFYTNLHSAKAPDLAANARAALVFHWQPLHRQVRVEGPVSVVASEESDAYFATRPRGAQLAAWASPQSEVIPDREALDEAFRRLEREHQGLDVPRPPWWGGYRLVPDSIEFWQGRKDRMHDRLRYVRRADGSWLIARLAP